jgi:N-acetylglucosaminyldiphosphoundecaprenol N-acetyl-beta-D-mannosaminyltransferase
MNYTNLLGVKVSTITYKIALRKIEQCIKQKRKKYICIASLHLIYEAQKDKNLLSGINQAGLVTPDGMPLVWLSWLNGKLNTRRVYGPNLMLKLCNLARTKGYRIYLLGGSKGQSRYLKISLQKKFPLLNIVGNTDSPVIPIPKQDTSKIINEINRSKAQIVFVGMGCPYQEKWMTENHQYLKAYVTIGVGAAFNFLTGKVKQAPVWMQNTGLEWLFRLIQEPLRLWKRYLNILIRIPYLVAKKKLINDLMNFKY